jgi:hypothetical protein
MRAAIVRFSGWFYPVLRLEAELQVHFEWQNGRYTA